MMNDAKLVFRSAKNFFSFEFSEDRGSRLLIVDCSRFAENASEEFSRMSGHPSGPLSTEQSFRNCSKSADQVLNQLITLF